MKAPRKIRAPRKTAAKAQSAPVKATSITHAFPKLKPGEKRVGSIILPDGRVQHTILLPGDRSFPNWDAAKAWSEKQGGTLPDRVEQALMFKFLRNEFKPEWYWSCEEAPNPGYAFVLHFAVAISTTAARTVGAGRAPSAESLSNFVIQCARQ